MARYFALGNGEILVLLNKQAQISDFYFPFVGEENHVNGKNHRLGFWVDNELSQFDSNLWEKSLDYKDETLVTKIYAKNKKLGLEVEINDTIHHKKNIFLRKIVTKNSKKTSSKIKLFYTKFSKSMDPT